MGQLVFILGRSGTGKSYSMRNFPQDKLAVINVQGKILPFKGAGKIETTSTDQSTQIIKALEIYGQSYKSIVVDDYQYTMANEFMRRSAEKGYDKFTEIGRHAWDIASKVRELPNDVIVYIMCHTDRDDEGNEKIKTIGKLLDEKICLEGMSTIVLKTNVTDGEYSFFTQNNGKDTAKSPAGMFPSYAIENDLYYVDQKIRNYYELGEYVSDDQITAMDEVAKKDIEKEEKPKRRSRKADKEKVNFENGVEIAEASSVEVEAGTFEEVMDQIEPEIKEAPKRKRRTAAAEPTDVETPETPMVETPEEPKTEEAPRRRRRRN